MLDILQTLPENYVNYLSVFSNSNIDRKLNLSLNTSSVNLGLTRTLQRYKKMDQLDCYQSIATILEILCNSIGGKSIKPNFTTFSLLITLCSHLFEFDNENGLSRSLMVKDKLMPLYGKKPNSAIYSTILRMGIRGLISRWDETSYNKLCDILQELQLPNDTVDILACYHTVMREIAYSAPLAVEMTEGKTWMKFLFQLFDTVRAMDPLKVQPTLETYMILLHAALRIGEVDRRHALELGESLLAEIKDLVPSKSQVKLVNAHYIVLTITHDFILAEGILVGAESRLNASIDGIFEYAQSVLGELQQAVPGSAYCNQETYATVVSIFAKLINVGHKGAVHSMADALESWTGRLAPDSGFSESFRKRRTSIGGYKSKVWAAIVSALTAAKNCQVPRVLLSAHNASVNQPFSSEPTGASTITGLRLLLLLLLWLLLLL